MIADWSLVAAFIDRLIPADDYPSATAAGLVGDLARDAAGERKLTWTDLLAPGFTALFAEVAARHDAPFTGLSVVEQDALVADLAAGHTRTQWPVDAQTFVATLIDAVAEKYYGARNAPGWALVGYSPAMRRGSGLLNPPVPEPIPTKRLAAAASRYDVIVVGGGGGGGIAASVLTQAGLKVLVVDRGEYLSYEQIGNDHLRNFRLSRYGLNLPPGAAAGPRVVEDARGTTSTAQPWEPGWGALPFTVGGGTRVYQGMAWRLTPSDFRLATDHGVPDGSSLMDWPIAYTDLEPYYTRIEQEIGVSGDGNSHRNQGFRSMGYPMPPLPDNTEAQVLRRGAEALGLSTGPVPMLINSVPRDGRGQCAQCGECVGFACPTDAKNGPFNTLLPVALRSGCDMVVRARALEVCTNANGTVTGVRFVDEDTEEHREIEAAHVVVACAAVETARLLLSSRSTRHPDGLGNHSDQLGRHLQGHIYVGGFGLFDEPVIDGAGPNVRISTCDYVNNLPGAIGGGALHNEVVKLPALHRIWALPPDAPRWGIAGKDAMRHLYRRTSHIFGPIQETPRAATRVVLDPQVKDRHGVAVARIIGGWHPESLRAAELQRQKALDWLDASGATRTWGSGPAGTGTPGGQHQAGTCRMGEDPGSSVTDPYGRVHGHQNLWVMDGSVHVTNGGFNPVLTILALAYRNAEQLARS